MGSFRRGAMVGFGIGYLQGAKAGRQRYEQIMQKVQKVDLQPVKEQGQKAMTAVMEKTGGVKEKLSRNSSDNTPSTALPNTKSA